MAGKPCDGGYSMVGRTFENPLFDRLEDGRRFLAACGFDEAAELGTAQSNTSVCQPHVEDCTARTVEPVVERRAPPRTGAVSSVRQR